MTETAHKRLEVDIITPAGVIDRGHAGFVAAMSAAGELGILPGHASLVSRLGIGEVRVHRDTLGGETCDYYAIKGGILQVEKNHLTLLVPLAVAGEKVDVAVVEADLKRTIEALGHPESDERFEELLGERRWCEARLSVSRKSMEN